MNGAARLVLGWSHVVRSIIDLNMSLATEDWPGPETDEQENEKQTQADTRMDEEEE